MSLVDKLQAWLDEATSDEPSDMVTGYGLCQYVGYSTRAYYDLQDALDASGLDTEFPFGSVAYFNNSANETHHLNPDRLAWVRQYIKDHSDVQD